MLILTRRIGETIIIGDNIKITVTNASELGKSARLGIDAPREVRVLREELLKSATEPTPSSQ